MSKSEHDNNKETAKVEGNSGAKVREKENRKKEERSC